jgi:hypothetical protein
LVKESCKVATLEVERVNGADGEISVEWKTIDGSAKSPSDFQGGEGILNFKHGEIVRTLEIPIVDDLDPEKVRRVSEPQHKKYIFKKQMTINFYMSSWTSVSLSGINICKFCNIYVGMFSFILSCMFINVGVCLKFCYFKCAATYFCISSCFIMEYFLD